MKKLFTFILALASAAVFPLTASAATHYDPARAVISYQNAPADTAYLDILVKMSPDDENYAEFTQPPQSAEITITPESEIAKYSEGGYVSLSLHHKKANALEFDGGEVLTMHSTAQVSCDLIDLSIAYGDFKAAYVDKSGNVLSVTAPSVTQYSTKTPYGFSADGSSLIFQRHGAHPAVIAVIFAVVVLSLISLPIIIAMIYHRRTKKITADDLEKKARKNLK